MFKDFTILLVEHDAFDKLCFERAMRDIGLTCPLVISDTPKDALKILLNNETSEGVNRPYIIFSDLDIPETSGIELLEAVRGNARLKNSVFFLCSSKFKIEDVAAARHLKVNGFMSKFELKRGLSVTMDHLSMSRRLAA